MADIENMFLWAIKNGEMEEVKTYVEKDPKIVNKELKNRYPLHHAADYGQKEVIEFLLAKGADVNKADKHGITPLLAAIYEQHISCIQLLLSKGADKKGKTPDGTSYLEAAETEEIKKLLK